MKDYFRPLEQPEYETLVDDGDFEIRQYQHIRIADVTVGGDQVQALREGFKILAKYISGENSFSKKIPMMSPVFQTSFGAKWQTSFILPKGFDNENLPLPLDKKIRLGSFPKRKMIAYIFSGNVDEINLDDHYQILKKYLNEKNIITSGNPLYAFYNPPWIPSFMKRNEILLEVIS